MNNTKNNYAVVFKGSFQDGIDKSNAIQAFADLFKIDPSKASDILQQACVLKKDLDHKSASKYLIAIEKTGIVVELVNQARDSQNNETPVQNSTENTESSNESDKSTEQKSTTNKAQASDTTLKILPVGSDVLTEQERPKVTEQDIDTSHIKMASVFLNPEDSNATTDIETLVHIPNLTIADVGEELLVVKPRRQTATNIDSNFDLKPAGSDLLEENEKQSSSEAVAPDTSHLSLED